MRQRGAGEPLLPSVQNAIEAQTDVDMSSVRVHRDDTAHTASRALHARAFTHGNNIWLGSGESPTDLRLMAHEATHVVQQGAADRSRQSLHPTARTPLRKNRAAAIQPSPAPAVIVQRAIYVRMDSTGVLLLQIPFGDDIITHFVALDTEDAAYFEQNDALAQNIEDELGRIFNPETQPLHETAAYLGGPAIKQMIERGIHALQRTGSYDFSDLAHFLQERTALFYSQNLLPAATGWLADQLSVQPAEIDWNELLPVLQTRAAAFEPVTMIDASLS